MTDNNSNRTDGRTRMLIEDSLPVRTIGIECERERKGKFPPLNRYHIWWARRPLIAARTAVLSSIISDEEMDIGELIERMGITDNTVEKYKTVDDRPDGQLVYEHYGYRRPFTQTTKEKDIEAIHQAVKNTWDGELPTVLDPTAGGGAIPFESRRYEIPTIANELNPVASVLLHGVLDHPTIDEDISPALERWGEEISSRINSRLDDYYPERDGRLRPINYLWAHTVSCPDCGITVPLSPSWWLEKKSARKGKAARPIIDQGRVRFEIVTITTDEKKAEQNQEFVLKEEFDPSDGTVSYGKGECPNCSVTIDGDEIKGQAQSEGMGFQLYGVEFKDEQSGNRGEFRAPTEKDEKIIEKAEERVNSDPDLSSLLSEERYIGPADRAENYGIDQWRDAFTPRQLIAHYELWQAFEEVKPKIREEHTEAAAEAILTILAVTSDKCLDYNSRFSSWHNGRTLVRNTFDRHDFSFKWSFAEPVLTDQSHGYYWFLEDVIDVFEELQEYISHVDNTPLEILNQNAAALSLEEESVEAVVMDPPYYDNVIYSELSDYFYVWLKKYLGDVYPDLFTGELTNKHEEAVANPAEFEDIAGKGQSKSQLAEEDYESKMSDIFSECDRVLTKDGVLTLMFTHKKTEAWDTLTQALIKAGFTIHASHPISTENPRSLHQSGKNSAQSTIFLTARKRTRENPNPSLWEDVREETKRAARERVEELDEKEVEFSKVDMMLASFGPTLEVFTKRYPVVNDEGTEISPEVALDEAREAVRDYLNQEYLNAGIENVDPKSEWYILAWLVFEAQRFPYDEARRLALTLGEDLSELKKPQRMWRKRGGDIILRPHSDRVQDVNKKRDNRSSRKPVDPDSLSFATSLDKVHAAMHVYDAKGATEAWNWLNDRNCGSDPAFKATLEALLRVLPHENEDWQLCRDLAAGETGELLDLDLSADIFRDDDEEGVRQGSLKEF